MTHLKVRVRIVDEGAQEMNLFLEKLRAVAF